MVGERPYLKETSKKSHTVLPCPMRLLQRAGKGENAYAYLLELDSSDPPAFVSPVLGLQRRIIVVNCSLFDGFNSDWPFRQSALNHEPPCQTLGLWIGKIGV